MSKPPRGLVILLLATSAVLLLSVAGLVGYWSGKKATQPTTSQGNSSEQSPQSRFPEKPSPKPADETAGWTTFTNEDVTFKYPSDWELGKRDIFGSSSIQPIEDLDGIYSLAVEIRINYENTTGKPFLNPLEIFTDPKRAKQKTTLDGEPAVKVLPYTIFAGQPEEATYIELYFLSKDSKLIYILRFSTKSASAEKVEGGAKTFDQILPTFKFLE